MSAFEPKASTPATEFEYIRHGTLCWMGAYDVRNRKLFGFTADKRGGEPFVQLLACVDQSYPTGRGRMVCDNLSDHDTDDVLDWLDDHPRWTLHFTPKHERDRGADLAAKTLAEPPPDGTSAPPSIRN